MFEIDGEATTAQILDSAAALTRARIELDNAVLLHAVAWADRNGPETIHPDQLTIRGGNHPVQLGGDGTPEVADFASAELGAALNLSAGAASALVADSLDLRHRLPRLWAKIVDCSFPGWQGRKIAKETRNLTKQQAAQVDRRLADYAGTVAWSRLENRLAAAVADADSHAAEREAQLAQAQRGVWVGQSNTHGVKTFYAKMDAPAAIRLLGQVNRISDILGSRGIIGNADSRRATALDVLGDPVKAAWLIASDRQPELFDPASIASTPASPAGPEPSRDHCRQQRSRGHAPPQRNSHDPDPAHDRRSTTDSCPADTRNLNDCAGQHTPAAPETGTVDQSAAGTGQHPLNPANPADPADDTGDDDAVVAEGDIHPSQRDLPGDQPACDDSSAGNQSGAHTDIQRLLGGQSNDDRAANDQLDQGSDRDTDGSLEAFQAAVARIIDNLDLNQLRPTTQLIVHASAETLHRGHGTLRCETSTPSRRQAKRPAKRSGRVVEDLGPMTLPTVASWLLHHRITLRPVIDLNKPPPPVDSYEIPRAHRQHLALRYPASLFPWSTSKQGLDLDHVVPYLAPERGGPPGQTSIANLAPVSRREHRLFTHAGWRRRQPEPGTLLVRAPHGHIYLTNNTGTHNLGTSQFAETVWNAARDSDRAGGTASADPTVAQHGSRAQVS